MNKLIVAKAGKTVLVILNGVVVYHEGAGKNSINKTFSADAVADAILDAMCNTTFFFAVIDPKTMPKNYTTNDLKTAAMEQAATQIRKTEKPAAQEVVGKKPPQRLAEEGTTPGPFEGDWEP